MESYPLLGAPAVMAGVLDYKNRPITKHRSGRWTAAAFILGLEVTERIAYGGIMFNLISYMTGPLGMQTAAAAISVSVWSGATMILPIAGAFIAESFLSRYYTIVLSSIIYILALGMLSISAMSSSRLEGIKVTAFYFSLYMVAVGEGGNRPCVQAFGADQFDEEDEEECGWRSSFFNLWFFVISMGQSGSYIVLSYVQDNVSWGLGFGIPCILMAVGTAVFMAGSRFYRCYAMKETKNWGQFALTFLVSVKKRILPMGAYERVEAVHHHRSVSSDLIKLEDDKEEEEEVNRMFRLFPIWASCLLYSVFICQLDTFFIKQGATMDRRLVFNFHVPSAGLHSLYSLAIVFFVPLYDRVAVPFARRISGIPSGITMLHRIGTGLLLSIFVMVISAIIESRRLQIAKQFDLMDDPGLALPMSIIWLFPQYILTGIASVFTVIGVQEFFYDQVPDTLRSFGVAIFLSIFGTGNFVNSLLVYVTDRLTINIWGESWFSDNLNRGRLDCFYWLLAFLSFCWFALFVCFARRYVYKKKVKKIGF